MKKNNKGFTLAELLIVVAIIAVLAAIAIPVFSSQLEKAREATDIANLRSAYAECMTSVMTGVKSSDSVTLNDDGSAQKTVALTQEKEGWLDTNAKVGDVSIGNFAAKANVVVKVTKDGVASFTAE